MSDLQQKLKFISDLEDLIAGEETEVRIFKLQYILCIVKRIRKILGKHFSDPNNL